MKEKEYKQLKSISKRLLLQAGATEDCVNMQLYEENFGITAYPVEDAIMFNKIIKLAKTLPGAIDDLIKWGFIEEIKSEPVFMLGDYVRMPYCPDSQMKVCKIICSGNYKGLLISRDGASMPYGFEFNTRDFSVNECELPYKIEPATENEWLGRDKGCHRCREGSVFNEPFCCFCGRDLRG